MSVGMFVFGKGQIRKDDLSGWDRIKAGLRARDERALIDGSVSREDLQEVNSLFSGFDLSRASIRRRVREDS